MKVNIVIAFWRALASVPFLWEVLMERIRQEARWGPQRHPSFGPDGPLLTECAIISKEDTRRAVERHELSWQVIFNEEVFEAMCEPDPAKLHTELVQSAAVAAAWSERI